MFLLRWVILFGLRHRRIMIRLLYHHQLVSRYRHLMRFRFLQFGGLKKLFFYLLDILWTLVARSPLGVQHQYVVVLKYSVFKSSVFLFFKYYIKKHLGIFYHEIKVVKFNFNIVVTTALIRSLQTLIRCIFGPVALAQISDVLKNFA